MQFQHVSPSVIWSINDGVLWQVMKKGKHMECSQVESEIWEVKNFEKG
jgi:hypothetical protein